MVIQHALSLAEYLALPEEKPYREFMHGIAVQKPMTNNDHGDLVSVILYALMSYARDRGGKAGPEVSVLLGTPPDQRVLLPDVAFWAAGLRQERYPTNPPTLAVEVRSPSQSLAEQREKCRYYCANGVAVAWLVDPARQTVEVFEGMGELSWTVGDLQTAALPGFELTVAEVFEAMARD